MSDKIVRLPAVMAATGMTRSLIYLYIKQGKFPKQVKLGERSSGWVLSEIQAWIDARVASRDGGQS